MGTAARFKLAKKLRQLRKKHGFTQQRLAEKARLDYKYLQKIEGKDPPSIRLDTLERLAKAFKIPLSKLLDF